MNEESAAKLEKSLKVLPDVRSVAVSVARGMVEIESRRDLEAQVRLACEVAGATFRTRARL